MTDAISNRLAQRLVQLTQAVKRVSLSESETFSLTPVQQQTVLFCGRTRPDVASVGHLARLLATSHATAVGVVDGLVRRGLLYRREKPEDRRVTLLGLTDEGIAVYHRLSQSNFALESAIGSLQPDIKISLERGLEALAEELASVGLLQLSEPCDGCVFFERDASAGTDRPHYCRYFRAALTVAETQLDCPKFTPRYANGKARISA